MSGEEFIWVKVCSKCGKELPRKSKARACPYCGGSLTTKLRRKEKADKRREFHHAMPSGKKVSIDKG